MKITPTAINRYLFRFFSILLSFILTIIGGAQEIPVTSKVKTAGVFKNGLMLIQEEVTFSQPGKFVLTEVPTAVHGSFFLESEVPVTITTSRRSSEIPFAEISSGGDIRRESEVTWNPGSEKTIRREQPVLLFDVQESENSSFPQTVQMTWLGRGLTWAPSYQINLLNGEKATIEQVAILINQWRDLREVEFDLISGFPQVDYQRVSSPLSPGVTLESFFQMLTQRDNDRYSSTTQRGVMTQMAMMNSAIPSAMNTTSATEEAGELSGNETDTFYQRVGKKSLLKGDRTQWTIARQEMSYEKLIYWNINNGRDDWGRSLSEEELKHSGRSYARTTSGGMTSHGTQMYQEPWEVIRFRNPFDFPMTTAPASLFSQGRFLGQTTSFWINPGERGTLPITKALSLRVQSKESERRETPSIPKIGSHSSGSPSSSKESNDPLMQAIQLQTEQMLPGFTALIPAVMEEDSPQQSLFILPPGIAEEQVSVDGRNQRRINVDGTTCRVAVIDATITLSNHRKESMTVQVGRRFLGELLAPEHPETDLPQQETLAAERYGINRSQELTWIIVIPAGSTKELKFSYQVLIRI